MDDLEYLREKSRLVDAVTELFVATDLEDWSRAQACFTESVYFDQTSLTGGEPSHISPSDITASWDEGLKPLQAIHHQIGNIQVVIKGEKATVNCYGTAYHYLPNKSGKNTRTFVGSYAFELVKRSGTWKINSFIYNVKFIDGNKDLERTTT